MKKAIFRKILQGFTGDARLYELSDPLKDEDEGTEYNFVVVSATRAMFTGPETYIFGADEDGKVDTWSELPGSMRGILSHDKALEAAGYRTY